MWEREGHGPQEEVVLAPPGVPHLLHLRERVEDGLAIRRRRLGFCGTVDVGDALHVHAAVYELERAAQLRSKRV
jgi:hypothetical protein